MQATGGSENASKGRRHSAWASGSDWNVFSGSTFHAKGTRWATVQRQERTSQWSFPVHCRKGCVERCEEGQAEVTMGDQGMRGRAGRLRRVDVTWWPARSTEQGKSFIPALVQSTNIPCTPDTGQGCPGGSGGKAQMCSLLQEVRSAVSSSVLGTWSLAVTGLL